MAVLSRGQLKGVALKVRAFRLRKARSLGIAVAAAAMMAAAHGAAAAGISYIWLGTSNSTWDTTSSNWSGGTGKWANGTTGLDNSVTFDTTAAGYSGANGQAIATSGSFTFISGITFAQGGWTLGASATTATLTNTDSAGITITDTGANTVNAKIAGATKLTINGTTAGTDLVTLAGVSTSTSAVVINHATVIINAATGLGNNTTNTSTVAINQGVLEATATMSLASARGMLLLGSATAGSGGTIDVAGGSVFTLNDVVNNNGGVNGLIKTDSGTLAMAGANLYSGTTTVEAGTLSSTSTTRPFGNGGTIFLGDTGGTASATLAWAPTGGAAITNGLTVQNGSTSNTLSIDGSTSSATFSGAFAVNNAVTIAETTAGRLLSFSGRMTGSSAITIGSGNAGTIIFANTTNPASTYSGAITINAGTLNFTAGSLGSGTIAFGGNSTLQWNGGTDDLSSQLQALTGSTVGTLDTNGSSVTFSTANGLAGSSTSGLTKVADSGGVLTLAAANSFSGTYTPATTGGATLLMNANALQNATVSLLAGNTGGGLAFDSSVTANGRWFTLGNLTGAGSLSIQDNALTPDGITLSIGGNGGNSTLSGVLSGAGSLVWNGAGTLSLSGVNTYTGDTTVQGGILKIAIGGSIARSARIIVGDTPADGGANLDVSGVLGGFHVVSGQTLGGHGSITGAVTVDSGAHLSPGNTIGTTTYNTGVSFSGGSILDFEFGTAMVGHDFVGGSGDLLVDHGGAGSLGFTGGELSVTLNALSGAPAAGSGSYEVFGYTNTGAAPDFVDGDGVTTGTIFLGGGWDTSDFKYLITNDLANDGIYIDYAPAGSVPEPASLALLGFGALGLLARRR